MAPQTHSNRYAGSCEMCFTAVPPGAGVIYRDSPASKWQVRCVPCHQLWAAAIAKGKAQAAAAAQGFPRATASCLRCGTTNASHFTRYANGMQNDLCDTCVRLVVRGQGTGHLHLTFGCSVCGTVNPGRFTYTNGQQSSICEDCLQLKAPPPPPPKQPTPVTSMSDDLDTPSLDKLIKLMKMTTASNDGEALNAVRMANAMLTRLKADWERLLRGKVTVIEDPFSRIATPPVYSSVAPAMSRPPPPPPPRPRQTQPTYKCIDCFRSVAHPNTRCQPCATSFNMRAARYSYAPRKQPQTTKRQRVVPTLNDL